MSVYMWGSDRFGYSLLKSFAMFIRTSYIVSPKNHNDSSCIWCPPVKAAAELLKSWNLTGQIAAGCRWWLRENATAMNISHIMISAGYNIKPKTKKTTHTQRLMIHHHQLRTLEQRMWFCSENLKKPSFFIKQLKRDVKLVKFEENYELMRLHISVQGPQQTWPGK